MHFQALLELLEGVMEQKKYMTLFVSSGSALMLWIITGLYNWFILFKDINKLPGQGTRN